MKTCPVCGCEFDPPYGWQKYCSPGCRKVVQLQQQREWYYANQAIKSLPDSAACEICGATFEPRSGTHRYCRTCAEEKLKRYKREFTRRYRAEGREDRSGWKPASKEVRRERWQRYYAKHKEEILDRIRHRRYEQGIYPGKRSELYWENRFYLIYVSELPCLVCGTREDLHAHHIIPVEDGGSDELDNLVVLCETHHTGSGTGFHSLGVEEFAEHYGIWLGPDSEI